MVEVVKGVLELLEQYFVYVYPGFVTILVHHFAKARGTTLNKSTLGISVVISYVKNVQLVFSEGNAGEEIVKHIIPAVEPDLLIIGALSRTGIRKYFGSQAAYIVKYSPISVLVVR